MPCGGKGRCAVIVETGSFQRRSAARLSPGMMEEGHVLACQTVVQGDPGVTTPAQERIERRLPTGQRVVKVEVPLDCTPPPDQSIRKPLVDLDLASLDDNVPLDEWMSAMFLPHTHIEDFPSVLKLLKEN